MNIVTISQLVDTYTLSRLHTGATIVTRVNNLLSEEQKINLDYTGVDIYKRYTELSPELRMVVYSTEILDNNEALGLSNDLAVQTRHDKLIAIKDHEVKLSTINGVSVTLVAVILVLCGLLLGKGYGLNSIHQTPLVTTVNKGLIYVYDYVYNVGTVGGP